MLIDKKKVSGFIYIYFLDADGTERIIFVENVVTGVGLQRMASHHADANPGKALFTHMSIGDDDSAEASEDDVVLTNQIYISTCLINAFGATLFGTMSLSGSDIGGDSYDLKEFGLKDSEVGGNLIARHVLEEDNQKIGFSGADSCDIIWGLVNLNG